MKIEDKRTDCSVEFSKINTGECFFSIPDMPAINLFLKTMSFTDNNGHNANAILLTTGHGVEFEETEKVYPAKVKVVIE